MSGNEPGELSQAASMRRVLDSRGHSYVDIRPSWRPRFGVAYRDLAVGWAVLVGVVGGMIAMQEFSSTGAWVMVPVASLAVGGALHHLFLFLHEASHFNLARDRQRNDRIANLLIGPLLGQSVAQYRRVHFVHHRQLGTPDDSERSYFEALNLASLLRSLTGVRLVEVALQRLRQGSGSADASDPSFAIAAGVLHACVVLFALAGGQLPLAVAWSSGILVILPFLSSTRQTLEHRSETARADVDYASVAHGETNRIFGDGLVAKLLGGAGFNRHLLHYWDPQLSYTRLPDLEAFLMETELAGSLDRARTTYGRAFIRLFERSA